MRNKIAALAIALFVSPVAWAQVETAVLNERLDALRQRLERVKAFHDRLPENKQRALSSGAQNMVHMAQRWGEVEATLRSAPRDLSASRRRSNLKAALKRLRHSQRRHVALGPKGFRTQTRTWPSPAYLVSPRARHPPPGAGKTSWWASTTLGASGRPFFWALED